MSNIITISPDKALRREFIERAILRKMNPALIFMDLFPVVDLGGATTFKYFEDSISAEDDIVSGKMTEPMEMDELSKLTKLEVSPIERKIAELEALRQRAETTVEEKYYIRKEIAHQKQMLYSLKGKNIAINRKQRKIMISKFHKEQKREKLLGKQQGKVSVYEDRLDRIAELQEMLSPEDSFIDRIKNGYYNLKGKYYERKLDRAEEVLEIMQQSDSNIVVRGANVVNLGRRAADTLRNRMHRSRETAETLANNAPTQNNPGTALSVVVR